ncbi:hypothetical protein BJX96DRAFT_162182 [Aspergillus floccosus]
MQTSSRSGSQSVRQSTAPGPRPHQCAFCRKRFTKTEHLCRHLRTHTGSRPFECSKCHKRFSRQDTLSRHMRIHAYSAENEGLQYSQALQAGSCFNASSSALLEELDLLSSPDVITSSSGQELHHSIYSQPTYMDLHENMESEFPELELWPSIMREEASQTTSAQPLGSDQGLKLGGGDDRLPTRGPRAVQELAHSIREMTESLASDASTLLSDPCYLETCIHMFFTRFIPVIPAIHMPTYVATEPTYPLLLTMMAVGSSFITEDGSSTAKIGHIGDHTLDSSIMTITFLGQCYAMLSGKKDLRESGLMCIATAFQRIRREGLYETSSRLSYASFRHESSSEKEKRWKAWATQEAFRRSILGYYILDGLMADLSGRPTTVRHISNMLPIPSDDSLFYASTADEWLTELQKQEDDGLTFSELYELLLEGKPIKYRPLSYLTIRVIMEGIHSCVGEHKSNGGRVAKDIPSRAALYNILTQLRLDHILHLSASDRVEHEIRWHVICISLVIDLQEIQQQLSDPLQEVFAGYIDSWLGSAELRCALLHSTAILNLCQQLSFGRSHCIHIHSALFAAATAYISILHCLCRAMEKQCLWIPQVADWDDVRHVVYKDPPLLDTTRDMSEVVTFLTDPIPELAKKMPVRNLRGDVTTMLGLLQQLGVYMGISREFSRTVTEWLSRVQPGL